MPQYMKTTGSLVTVKPKKESAANQGRMLLDDALIEMLDIMLPVGELKTFATDETDSWIAKMAEYNQEWAEPDGRLLKVSDYPDLFNLIGYNYGWSNTNPNSTYTYSFTDVNGVARSLQIYSDLDIDGNAKPVEGSPAYFRIPNLAGRFLRSAGTATYVNKWTDTDGNVRHLLTEYSAPMYKGQLDAIRDITGAHEAVSDTFSAWATNYKGDGAILDITVYDEPYCRVATTSTDSHSNGFSFDAARVVPATIENRSLAQVTRIILRIAWDITGTKQRVYFDTGKDGTIVSYGTGAFKNTTGARYMQMGEGVYWMAIKTLTFDASRVVPSFNELSPVGINVSALFRVAWDIRGGVYDLTDSPNTQGPFYYPWGYDQDMRKYWSSADVITRGWVLLDVSRIFQTGPENIPMTSHLKFFLRIAWDIMGTFNIRNIGTETSLITKPDGMFKYSSLIEGYAANSINANLTFTNFHAHIKFDSAFRNPSSGREYSPVTECVKSLIRILWDITGEVGDGIPADGKGVGMFIKAIGCFQGRDSSYDLMGNLIPNTNVKASAKLGYSSAYMVPAQKENIPALYTAIIMLRIFWAYN